MAEFWEWTGEPGPWQDNEAPALNWNDFTSGGPGSWYGQETTDWANGPGDTSSGNWLQSVLGSLGSLSGVLGPALSAAGSIAGGAIGSNAASNAAGLQSQALNRGIDLQTAQWLQQQGNLAPYLQAGQGGLAQLQQLAGREAPALPGQIPSISAAGYALPQIAPTWGPMSYQGPQRTGSRGSAGPTAGGGMGLAPSTGDVNQLGNVDVSTVGRKGESQFDPMMSWGSSGTGGAGGGGIWGVPNPDDYAWNPQQGPRAQDYRYTPGQTPDAAAYRYTPGAVPTLSGKELLANDPGYQFRMDESRKALEGSAAARGDLLSGGNLKALQSRSQDLASQEYGNAWNRASQQAQMREGWAQQAGAQNFGQAMSAAQLREQVNQIASQQGWSQSQAEAAFREAMASQASQQGFGQALQGQQAAWQQGLAGQQWEQQQRQAYDQSVYDRMFQQSQTQYGRDVSQNATDYDRSQAAYRQQLAQYLLPWEQQSTLATLGGQAVGMYGTQGQNATSAIANLLGQQGTAQAMGTLGSAGQWNNAIAGGVGGLQNILRGLNS